MDEQRENEIWERIKADLNNPNSTYGEEGYRELSLLYASKLNHQSDNELLSAADKIYNWLKNK